MSHKNAEVGLQIKLMEKSVRSICLYHLYPLFLYCQVTHSGPKAAVYFSTSATIWIAKLGTERRMRTNWHLLGTSALVTLSDAKGCLECIECCFTFTSQIFCKFFSCLSLTHKGEKWKRGTVLDTEDSVVSE